MYAIYNQIQEDDYLKFEFKERTSLAGRTSGLIPKLLKSSLREDQNEPFQWHLPISLILAEKKESLIIDVKPYNRKEDFIFLCELTDVFGYSDSGWTPILLRLKGLFVDEPAGKIDKNSFKYPIENEPPLIFTMLHLSGSVKQGKLVETWNYPGPSPTNSVLLWPEVFRYFIKSINKNDPNFLHGW